MLRFLGQRILYILLICIMIIFVLYLGMGMARNSTVQQPSYDLVRFGQGAWSRTTHFLEDLFSGELGLVQHETLGRVGIGTVLLDTFFKSMGLLGTALLAASIIGLLIGLLAALVKNKRIVSAVMILTILGVSTPSFFAGVLLQQAELKYLDLFGRALVKMAGFGWDLEHMLMPVLVLMARPTAYLTRAAFISFDQILGEAFIQSAYAKGLFKRKVILVHAFRNTAVPLLTAIGVSLRFSLSTLPVVEYFFAWPGIGLRLLEAIQQNQDRLVVAFALTLGLSIQLVNLALDISYRIIDPRLREES